MSQPISTLAEQGLYPPLSWQPASSSGSLALCTWYRNDSPDRVGRIRGGWEPPSRLLGPLAAEPGDEGTAAEINGFGGLLFVGRER